MMELKDHQFTVKLEPVDDYYQKPDDSLRDKHESQPEDWIKKEAIDNRENETNNDDNVFDWNTHRIKSEHCELDNFQSTVTYNFTTFDSTEFKLECNDDEQFNTEVTRNEFQNSDLASVSHSTEYSDFLQDLQSSEKQKSLERAGNFKATHTGEKIFPCVDCGKTFREKRLLKRHILIHTGEKPHKCSLCEKSFRQKGNLQAHIRTHTGEKTHECMACEKSFTSSCNLSQHMRTHTGEKPHKCTVCEKTFTTSSHLKKHMRTHSGDNPYTCTVCEKAFTNNTALKTHNRTHTGEKPYKCSICEKSFSQNSNLSLHMTMHTNEKPYECDSCEKLFSQKRLLKRHMKRVHPKATI